METVINSVHNPQIKYVISLERRRERMQNGSYCIEGVRLVEAALAAHTEFDRVFYTSRLLENERGKLLLGELSNIGCTVIQVTDALMEKIADTEHPQGVLAIVRMPHYDLTQLTVQPDALLIIVDRVQDPGNLGTIIRTADAAGVSTVFLLPGTVDLYNPKTIRATMGSIYHLPVIEVEPDKLFRQLKERNVTLCVAGLNGAESYHQVNYTGPIAFVLGNEANGVADELAAAADKVVKIPLYGQAESLNVAIAAGVLLYEAVRQRNTGVS